MNLRTHLSPTPRLACCGGDWVRLAVFVWCAIGVLVAGTTPGTIAEAKDPPVVLPSSASLAPSPDSAPPAPATTAAPVADPRADSMAGINQSLAASRAFLTTTNLLDLGSEQQRQQSQKGFEARLDAARQQRRLKAYPEAAANLVAILEAAAPEVLQQTALIELALVAQEQNELAKAQQILAQYLSRWPHDANVPEILLRQGILFRQMGLYNLAIGKFYSVMTSALTLKAERFDYYQRIVLQAQTEVAETQYLQGKYAEAADSLGRLLRLEAPALNRPQIQYKLTRCLANLGRHEEVIARAQDFLNLFPDSPEQPEVRFMLASALKQLGRNDEAVHHVLALLQNQQGKASRHPETLAYWQQRAGNAIANQFYREGDFLHALDIYSCLTTLDTSPAWQLPVWYQIGLIYEHMEQPAKAAELYENLLKREKELPVTASPSLRAVLDMARWRHDTLTWQARTAAVRRELRSDLDAVPRAKSDPGLSAAQPP